MNSYDLSKFRREYSNHSLNETDLSDEPLILFKKWMDKAISENVAEPFAMNLSTATLSGKPSARIVLLRNYSHKGFVFYTNYFSRKSREILENPQASMTFFWPELDRQVIVYGKVGKTSKEESDTYFQSRPFESRISAIISEQSKTLVSREYLDKLFKRKIKEFEGKNLIRPADWGGFRLKPESFEFWQGRPHRLNDRILYLRENKVWKKQRLSP